LDLEFILVKVEFLFIHLVPFQPTRLPVKSDETESEQTDPSNSWNWMLCLQPWAHSDGVFGPVSHPIRPSVHP
jgi:hypothetical protein